MKLRYAVAAVLALPLLACEASVEGKSETLVTDDDPTELPQAVTVTRERRRMDIDQLDAALRNVTGGLYWVKPGDSSKTNQFVALADTLGKPDYIEITQEDVAPTSLFLKFLDDAARAICSDLLKAEETREERVFVTPASFADAATSPNIDLTLRRVLLRFHGNKIKDTDTSTIDTWHQLYAKVVDLDTEANPTANAESHSKAAWNAVCVGLITHSDFYTY